MNLINPEFQKLYNTFYGTENCSLFLYSLVKCIRPIHLLEVGAGYSTLFLSQALKDIQKEIETPTSEFLIEEKKWKDLYNPSLTVIENETTGTSCKEIQSLLNNLDLSKYTNIFNINFTEYIDKTIKDKKYYDLIWLDFGAGDKYLYFFKKSLEILKNGGYIIVHNTLSIAMGKLFELELKLKIKDGTYPNLELISIFEPHKSQQNSFTVIKKIEGSYPINYMFA